MARGKNAAIGAQRVSANGYDYTKTADRGWVLTHWLIAEREILGRRVDSDERVEFVEGKRLHPENIRVVKKGTGSMRRRKAVVEDRIRELQAELNEINELLN